MRSRGAHRAFGALAGAEVRRLAPPFAAALALCALGFAAVPKRPLLLWNASASSPIGLYAVGPANRVYRGDMAVAWAPRQARRLAARRGYLPSNVPLVKRVAAVAGANVCAKGALVFVDGRTAALRRAFDPAGRPLPWWSGCSRLGPGDTFLLSAKAPDAFDGRYFGVTRRTELIGKARLVWRG
jgi:conjugative transfer signal peptidase TraF